MRFKFFSLAAFVFLFTGALWADRTVSVLPQNGKIELVNGSDVSVIYSYSCFDKNTGGAITALSVSNQTLAAKAKLEIAMTGSCSSAASSQQDGGSGVLLCTGSVGYANAATLCGTGMQVCTIQNLKTRWGAAGKITPSSYWLRPHTSNMAWFYSTDSGATWNGYNAGSNYGNYVPTTSMYNTGICKDGDGNIIGYCGQYAGDYTYGMGTACCPLYDEASSCKVTVHGSSSAGFLQSPQFKGGTAF